MLSNSNFSKDPSKVTPIELTTFMVAVNNYEKSVNPLPFIVKKKKGKSQNATPTLPQSQGPEASRSLHQKRKKPKSKKPPTKVIFTFLGVKDNLSDVVICAFLASQPNSPQLAREDLE
ncbi:hypothetical protein Tco_0247959 [Tanacetum coccineum]